MEKVVTTREKIIEESLKLFSKNGYDGVSMREIAAAVGIKGASIYNHFKGKEDIFEAIFAEIGNRYNDVASMMSIPTQQNEETVQKYLIADEKQLLVMSEGLFTFFSKDKFAAMFRQLLVCEQHKSELAAKCLKDYYFDAPIMFQTEIFKGMQQFGAFPNADAKILALHFYSPIYFILGKYDLGESFEACIELIRHHVATFSRIYK